MKRLLEELVLIPKEQFGTILLKKAFSDITMAFDNLPHTYHQVFQSYVTNRYYRVEHQEEVTTLYQIQSGVPQRNVLGLMLYQIYIAAVPTSTIIMTALFVDDSAIMTTIKNWFPINKLHHKTCHKKIFGHAYRHMLIKVLGLQFRNLYWLIGLTS